MSMLVVELYHNADQRQQLAPVLDGQTRLSSIP
jgi:hypothetical protein